MTNNGYASRQPSAFDDPENKVCELYLMRERETGDPIDDPTYYWGQVQRDYPLKAGHRFHASQRRTLGDPGNDPCGDLFQLPDDWSPAATATHQQMNDVTEAKRAILRRAEVRALPPDDRRIPISGLWRNSNKNLRARIANNNVLPAGTDIYIVMRPAEEIRGNMPTHDLWIVLPEGANREEIKASSFRPASGGIDVMSIGSAAQEAALRAIESADGGGQTGAAKPASPAEATAAVQELRTLAANKPKPKPEASGLEVTGGGAENVPATTTKAKPTPTEGARTMADGIEVAATPDDSPVGVNDEFSTFDVPGQPMHDAETAAPPREGGGAPPGKPKPNIGC